MNAFWKWMEEKGYADLNTLSNGVGHCPGLYPENKSECVYPTKQMLIGYMFEYIGLKNIGCSCSILTSCHRGPGLFDFLKECIEEK